MIVGTVMLTFGLVACSSDGEDSTTDSRPATSVPPLALGDVGPAVTAVEAALGGPQEYTEINVQTDLVNVFAAQPDGTELAYVYRSGVLETPDGPTPQPEGAVLFGIDGISFEKVEQFDDILLEELPDSALAGLALTGAPAGGAQWTATLVGSKGTLFDVLLSPDGAILGALPR